MKRRIVLAGILILLSFLMPLRASADAAPLTEVLVDTSGSMRGEKLEAAKSGLIDAINQGHTDLVIYAFAEKVTRISTESEARVNLLSAISDISAGSRTSLYDAILELITSSTPRPSQVIVLSDGGDSQSATSLEELTQQVVTSKIPISFVREFVDSRYLSSVTTIVNQSGGSYFDSLAKAFPNPNQLSPESNTQDRVDPWILALCAGYSSLIALLALTIRKRREERTRLETNRNLIQQDEALPASENGLSQLLLRFVQSIRDRLQHGRRSHEFERELPGALKVLAGSLGAGLSFLQAMNAYAEDGDGVSAQEFRRALGEIHLGVPIERALESVADRMNSEDLRWAVSAFAIQREVGGSLATILKSTAETIESRFELRREIKTLSAEGRISTYVLMALPAVIFLFLALLRPSYVSFYVTQTLGNLILIFVALSLVMSWLWMRSLIRIKV